MQCYGAMKVWKQLRREGTEVARCTVERLMRRAGLQGIRRGQVMRTTVAGDKSLCPLDRVQRQFHADRPNQLWVSDFTYVSTWQGWLYVAFVIDVFARRIVGWRVSTSMKTDFVLDALEQALYARQPHCAATQHLFPTLGARPVSELKTRDLKAPLKVAEGRDTLETASRLRQYITSILRMAVQQGLIDINPANDLHGSTATRKTVHRPALPMERLPELLARLDTYRGRPLTRLAVQITLQVFIRSSELRFARWDEVDFARALWTIPAERQAIEGVKHSGRGAKMGTSHLVPLSRQALALLERVHQLTGRFELIFPGDHSYWKPMSENTVNAALRRMAYDTGAEVCGHGFRAMACSALMESGLWSRDAVERKMSHQERNGVRAAYIHKAEHLEERRLMCQWWSDYLDAIQGGFITPYDFANQATVSRNVVRLKIPRQGA